MIVVVVVTTIFMIGNLLPLLKIFLYFTDLISEHL